MPDASSVVAAARDVAPVGLVERLGGWGALCLVCWWLMKRLDRTIDTLETAVKTGQKMHDEMKASITELASAVREAAKRWAA